MDDQTDMLDGSEMGLSEKLVQIQFRKCHVCRQWRFPNLFYVEGDRSDLLGMDGTKAPGCEWHDIASYRDF